MIAPLVLADAVATVGAPELSQVTDLAGTPCFVTLVFAVVVAVAFLDLRDAKAAPTSVVGLLTLSVVWKKSFHKFE